MLPHAVRGELRAVRKLGLHRSGRIRYCSAPAALVLAICLASTCLMASAVLCLHEESEQVSPRRDLRGHALTELHGIRGDHLIETMELRCIFYKSRVSRVSTAANACDFRNLFKLGIAPQTLNIC